MSLSRQEDFLTKGRTGQKQRTREALIEAATKMAREGHSLAIAEVAEAAKVSTATAYRYFPNPQSLWVDVTMRQSVDDWPTVVENLPPEATDRAERVVRWVMPKQLGDEALWRAVLRATIDRWFAQAELPEEERVPLRGSTRLKLTAEILAPLRDSLPPELFKRLSTALNLVYGVESILVTRDACGLEPAEAVDTMVWAAQALIKAALAEAAE